MCAIIQYRFTSRIIGDVGQVWYNDMMVYMQVKTLRMTDQWIQWQVYWFIQCLGPNVCTGIINWRSCIFHVHCHACNGPPQGYFCLSHAEPLQFSSTFSKICERREVALSSSTEESPTCSFLPFSLSISSFQSVSLTFSNSRALSKLFQKLPKNDLVSLFDLGPKVTVTCWFISMLTPACEISSFDVFDFFSALPFSDVIRKRRLWRNATKPSELSCAFLFEPSSSLANRTPSFHTSIRTDSQSWPMSRTILENSDDGIVMRASFSVSGIPRVSESISISFISYSAIRSESFSTHSGPMIRER